MSFVDLGCGEREGNVRDSSEWTTTYDCDSGSGIGAGEGDGACDGCDGGECVGCGKLGLNDRRDSKDWSIRSEDGCGSCVGIENGGS
jgi:hypothetical protein